MKKYIRNIIYIFILTFTILILSACSEKKYHSYNLTLDDSFNTNNVVTVFSYGTKSQEELEVLWDELNNILIDLDKLFNIQERENGLETELMKVNKSAGIEPIQVSDEVIYVLKEAINMSNRTIVNGVALFDPTIAPVWKLWDFVNNLYSPILDNRIEIPNEESIMNALDLVNYNNIIINEELKTVYLKKPGMEIDLGAIVKGYAADKLKNHLINRGYTKAIVDVGRNIQTLGSFYKKDLTDTPWTVKIQTPYVSAFDENYEEVKNYGTVYVTNKTVVTSGVYEKYIMDQEGNKYHHILDPRTGYPFNNGVVSITVITDESILADGYSTSLFSLGLVDGMKLVNSSESIETVWVIKNNESYEVYISEGLEGNFQFNTNVEKLGYVYKGVYK